MSNPEREHLPIPTDLTPTAFISFCLTLPHDSEHLAAFWGAVQALAHRYTWGKPLTTDSETVAAYWLNLIDENREKYEAAIMSPSSNGCCCDEPIFRFTQDGHRQVSHDGGETWEADPGDPRFSGNLVPPPLWLVVGGDNECNGAITARLNMETMVEQILTTGVDVGVSGVVGIIIAIVCAITAGVACAVAGLVGSFALALIQIGAATLEAAMTSTVYDTFQCILFCHISSDATFDEAGWNAVKADIADQLSGDAEFVLWNLVNTVGPQGLSNMALMSVAVSGDCDDCDCEECGVGVHLGEAGMNLTDLGEGVWTVEGTIDEFGNYNALVWLSEDELGCCDVGEQIALEGFVPVGFSIDCEGSFSTTGFPIPAGCYRWLGWRSPDGSGGPFKMQFELNPCP
jgi:hypothetical protein